MNRADDAPQHRRHVTETQRLPATAEGIATAGALLRSGALVAFATETVYGLGADARNGAAVAEVYAVKERPEFNPLIVHVAAISDAQRIAHWSDHAERLSNAFWPGPLTLVLPLKADAGLSSLVTAGLQSVALRIPAGQSGRALITAAGGAIAAPSANPSGRISPTTADHVLAGLGGRIAAVLDDGACSIGLESTIIGLTGAHPCLLRAGGLAHEDIKRVLTLQIQPPSGGEITAPGQLASHYAPRATVRLNAAGPVAGEVMLGFGAVPGDLNLSPDGNLHQAAAQLFAHLHVLDAMQKPIAVAPIPGSGLGVAINDRLRRAAAPR
ncbi:MAG: L-threonylcarbamoyladenylate synthase [Pseudomonadota bacterium]